MLILLILGYFCYSVVTSVTLSSTLIILKKKKKIPNENLTENLRISKSQQMQKTLKIPEFKERKCPKMHKKEENNGKCSKMSKNHTFGFF